MDATTYITRVKHSIQLKCHVRIYVCMHMIQKLDIITHLQYRL